LRYAWAAAAAIIAVAGGLAWSESQRDYRYYQEAFAQEVKERFGQDRAQAVPRGVQQVWLEAAGRVDRCTSCHLGVSWKGMEGAPQPFTTHPAAPLEHHPVDKFGCTMCHGGQGFAIDLPDAHGWVAHWQEPLLDKGLAEEHGIKHANAFLQMKCNVCHRHEPETQGAALINHGKKLIESKGCSACHVIDGVGGRIGPELTYEGDKHPEGYDFSRLSSNPSLYAWQVAHLQDPKSMSADSIMPSFGFTSEDAHAVALVLMSWKQVRLPTELLPGRGGGTRAGGAGQAKAAIHEKGQFFMEKTCFVCHDVSSFGIQAATRLGPDLALAVEDAPARFGRSLDDFLMSPSGTMEVVLSKQIILTDDERKEAIALLKLAYQLHQEKKARAAVPPAPASAAAPSPTH
jgi:cytochrome c2